MIADGIGGERLMMSQESGYGENLLIQSEGTVGSPEDEQITKALEEYARLRRAGQPPPRDEFLARYRPIAAALAECLDALEFVENAASHFAPARHRACNLQRFLTNQPVVVRRPTAFHRLVTWFRRLGAVVVTSASAFASGLMATQRWCGRAVSWSKYANLLNLGGLGMGRSRDEAIRTVGLPISAIDQGTAGRVTELGRKLPDKK
jgi:hypothetical protein